MIGRFFFPDSFLITCEELLELHAHKMSDFDAAYDPILNISDPWGDAGLDTILDFVRRWNNRVPVGRHVQKIKNKSRSLRADFEKLNGMVLERISFTTENVQIIQKIFSDLSNISLDTDKKKFSFGSTGPSKLMHAINPKLFVMWDYGICDYYGCFPNACGYIHFMQIMQHIARCLIKEPSNKEKLEATGRSLPKLIDEFNWMGFSTAKSQR